MQAVALLELVCTAKHLTHLGITFHTEAHVASYLPHLQQLKALKGLRLAGVCTSYMGPWLTHLSSLTGLTSLSYHHSVSQTLLQEDATALWQSLQSLKLKALSFGQIVFPDGLKSF